MSFVYFGCSINTIYCKLIFICNFLNYSYQINIKSFYDYYCGYKKNIYFICSSPKI